MIKSEIEKLINDCERLCAKRFKRIDEIALENQRKILNAFQSQKIAATHFCQTNGYGYDDLGREKLCAVFAKSFNCEDALVSPMLASGTHALSVALMALLRPQDTLFSITGAPYDTLRGIINGQGNGSLRDFNIKYAQCALNSKGKFNYAKIEQGLKKIKGNTVVFITRSRGYEWREALTIEEIEHACAFVRGINPNAVILVDNCYGEFVAQKEPCEFADLMAGSLIKNAGGGIAPTGGYIAGKAKYVKAAWERLIAPNIGGEVGSYAAGYRLFFQGLFLAPHIVAQCLKGSLIFGEALKRVGFETSPPLNRPQGDIIRAIKLLNSQRLIDFVRSIQYTSPVDSFAVCEPWAMPGYNEQVIMAAGCFVQGASIELSCDAPIREPYIAYIQGGLTYEHTRIALEEFLKTL